MNGREKSFEESAIDLPVDATSTLESEAVPMKHQDEVAASLAHNPNNEAPPPPRALKVKTRVRAGFVGDVPRTG